MIQPPPWKKTTVAPGGVLGPVDPDRDVAGRTGDGALLDAGDVHQHRRVVAGPHVDAAAASFVRGGVVEQRGFAVVLHGLQHPGDVGVQHDRVLLGGSVGQVGVGRLAERVHGGPVGLAHGQGGDRRDERRRRSRTRRRGPSSTASGPASTAAIEGAKPPRAKPNWVPTATPDIRTRVSNCSANIANADPAVGGVDDPGQQDPEHEDQQDVAGADRPDEGPDQRRGAECADQEHRLAADPVAQHRPGGDGDQRDQVGRDDHPQQAALGQAHRLDPVGQGVDAEDRADDRDQRGEQHLEHVGGVAAEQRLQRRGRHGVVLALLLERRALVQGPPDPPAGHDHHGAEQERDPPAPRQQRLLRQRGDRDEDRGGQDVAALRAGQGEAGEERAAAGRCMLQ